MLNKFDASVLPEQAYAYQQKKETFKPPFLFMRRALA